jgi:YegS/Rv2252/BmrU family lipid kinase
MKKIRFIINPKSGTGKKDSFKGLIEKHIDHSIFESEICFTEYAGHATILSTEASEKGFDSVVVVGGDGSVNEAAKALVGKKTALGIIPAGSGNGMARHLGIPVDPVQAISLLNTGQRVLIDTLSVNSMFCIGTIGIGFDAHVAHLFARANKRGYSTYVKLVLTEFPVYKDKKFSILVDGILHERNCFLLTIANSSQFGNNAVIAPFADERDGIIDISIMRKFPLLAAPGLIYRLMHNSIHRSRYFTALKGRHVVIRNNDTMIGHIDGEPVEFLGDLDIRLNPLSLNVIVQNE